MEKNKRNNKTKLFLFGVLVFNLFILICFSDNVEAGELAINDLVVSINGDNLKLSANGKSMEIGCAKKECKGYQTDRWCEPGSVKYNLHYDRGTACGGIADNYDAKWGDNTITVNLDYNSDCRKSVVNRIGWAAKGGCFTRSTTVGSESYKRSRTYCSGGIYCTEWHIDDSQLMSMFQIGRATVDPNLIEF